MPVTSRNLGEPPPNPITPQRAATAMIVVLLLLAGRLLLPDGGAPAAAPTPTAAQEPAPLLIEAQLPTSIPRPSAAPTAGPTAMPTPTGPATCPTPAPRPTGVVIYLARASDCPGLIRISVGAGPTWIARPPDLADAIYTSLPAQPAIP